VSANVPATGPAPVPQTAPLAAHGMWLAQIALRLNQLLAAPAANSARVVVTLNSNATSTTLTNAAITINSHFSLSPLTADAADLDGAPYVSAQSAGSLTLTHGSSAATDLTFSLLIIG
jgi:hypothetical protein